MSENRRAYISELRVQIEMIDDALKEIDSEVTWDAFGPKYSADQKAKRRVLLARRSEIRDRIIQAEN